MDSLSTSKLRYLLECSVCLDPFTRPKVLPCQHTYCYACLLTLVPDSKVIACPQCRKQHKIPDQGVQGYPDNLIINNLLGLHEDTDGTDSSPVETKPDAEAVLCCDCKKTKSASSCDHCDQTLCTNCLVKHVKFVTQIETILSELREYKLTAQRRASKDQDQIKESLQKVRVGKKKAEAEFNKMIEELERRRDYFEEYFSMVEVMYQDLLDTAEKGDESAADALKESASDAGGAGAALKYEAEQPSIFGLEDLDVSLSQSKTSTSLQSLMRRVCDIRSATRLILRGEEFRFVWEGAELGRLARVEAGQTVIEIGGQYTEKKTPKTPKPKAALKVGDRVRVKRTVENPRHGRGEIKYENVGTVKSIAGEEIIVDFPEHKDWEGISNEMELAPKVDAKSRQIQVGDRVCVKRNLKKPSKGWGDVKRGSVGTVISMKGEDMEIDFPEWKNWEGKLGEMELV